MQWPIGQKILNTAINSIQHIASNKVIRILYSHLADFNVFYDKDRILQELTILLSNAIKFCEPKKGVITVDYKMING